MVLIKRPGEEEELNQPGPQELGGSGVDSPPSSKPSSPKSTPQNFASLLTANRSTVDRLGQSVGGLIEGKSKAAGEAITGAQQKFNTAVDQGTTTLNQGLTDRIRSNPAGISGADEQAVFKQRDAAYKGPDTLEQTEFFAPAQTAVRNAAEAGERTNTSTGRRELLSQLSSGKAPTAGVANFDEALLYGSQKNRNLLREKAEATKPFGDLLTSASGQAQEKAAAGKATTEATKKATQDALSGARTDFDADLMQRLTAARQSAQSRIENAKKAAGQLGGFRFSVKKDPNAKGKYKLQEVYRTSKTGNNKYRDLTPEQIQKLGGNPDAIIAQYLKNKTTPFMQSGSDSFLYRPNESQFTDEAIADLGLNREALKAILNPEDAINKYRSKGLIKGQFEKLLGEYFEALAGNADYYTGDVGSAGDYVKNLSPDAELNLENVAGLSDYDRNDALNRLSGNQSLFLPSDRSKAGKGQMDLTAMNTKQLNDLYIKALNAAVAHSHYQREVNSRSGGDSFFKKYGGSLLTGGLTHIPGLPSVNQILGPYVLGPGVAGAVENASKKGLLGPTVDYAYEKLFPEDKATPHPVKSPEDDELERLLGGA